MFSNKVSEQLLERIRTGVDMDRDERLRLIINLSIPSILAQITTVLMFFIDASMVGRLGERATASIGLVESTTWLLWSITGAAATGFSVQVAHCIGSNDFDRVRQVVRHALVCTLSLSLLVQVIGLCIYRPLPFWLRGGEDIAGDASLYFLILSLSVPFFQLSSLSSSMLKCAGNMRLPSVISVLMCFMDVAFNYFFIYILDLGVPGAALGTSLAFFVGAALQSYFAFYRNATLSLRHGGGRGPWQWEYVRNAVRISTPMAVQSTMMTGAQVVSTMIVAPLGNTAIAANTMAITAESLCYMPGYGIGDAATTLVGQSLGAGRKALTRSFAHLSVAIGMAVMVLMGLVMYVFAYPMMELLTPVEEVVRLGASVLRIEAFAEPFFAASIVVYSVCVGAGDTLRPALYNLISMWCVRLSLAYVLAPGYGLKGVWVAMAVELTFRGCLFLWRLFSGKWMQQNLMGKASESMRA